MSKKITNPVNNPISNQASNSITNPIPRIDPEFQALIPPLSPEEYNQLEQNILAYKKCRDALVVWGDTLVDGHNRLRICATHSLPFEIKEVSFDSREEAMVWILDNQLGRRNLTDAMRIELALSKVELLKAKAKENQKRGAARGGSRKASDKSDMANHGASTVTCDEDSSLPDGTCDPDGKLFTKSYKQNDAQINVHKAAADEAGISHGTVQNYMEVTKHGSPELIEGVKSGELKIGTAHRLLDKEITKQLNLADKQVRSIVETIPKLHEWAACESFNQPRPDGQAWDTPPLTFDEIDFNTCESPNDMNIDAESANKGIMAQVAGLLEQIKELKEAYNA